MLLGRWRLALDLFGRVFCDDVGAEPGSIISELGGFPVKESRFRREMEKLRNNSQQRDLSLDVSGETEVVFSFYIHLCMFVWGRQTERWTHSKLLCVNVEWRGKTCVFLSVIVLRVSDRDGDTQSNSVWSWFERWNLFFSVCVCVRETQRWRHFKQLCVSGEMRLVLSSCFPMWLCVKERQRWRNSEQLLDLQSFNIYPSIFSDCSPDVNGENNLVFFFHFYMNKRECVCVCVRERERENKHLFAEGLSVRIWCLRPHSFDIHSLLKPRDWIWKKMALPSHVGMITFIFMFPLHHCECLCVCMCVCVCVCVCFTDCICIFVCPCRWSATGIPSSPRHSSSSTTTTTAAPTPLATLWPSTGSRSPSRTSLERAAEWREVSTQQSPMWVVNYGMDFLCFHNRNVNIGWHMV